jgi:mRNA degradation ribonuclease J1/J2
MEIKIIRGQNQIGGSVIAISVTGSSIILDAGSNLDEKGNTALPDVPDLFKKVSPLFLQNKKKHMVAGYPNLWSS